MHTYQLVKKKTGDKELLNALKKYAIMVIRTLKIDLDRWSDYGGATDQKHRKAPENGALERANTFINLH